MQAGNPPISRPPLAIDEYRFAESRAVHPPAFKFCRTWDRSRPWSSCSPVPHFGVLEYHRLQQGGGFIVVFTALNDSDGQHQYFDIKPAHHDSWLVAAEYTTPSARQSLPRQEPNLHALLYQNQKEFSVWQATTESCRATPSREQPPSHAPSQHVKVPPCHAARQGVDAHVGYFPQAPQRHSPEPPKLRPGREETTSRLVTAWGKSCPDLAAVC